jgi:hypothetical protein
MKPRQQLRLVEPPSLTILLASIESSSHSSLEATVQQAGAIKFRGVQIAALDLELLPWRSLIMIAIELISQLPSFSGMSGDSRFTFQRTSTVPSRTKALQ